MNNIYDNLIPGLCNVRMLSRWINIWRTFYFTGILGIKKLLVSNPAPSLFVSLLYFFWQKKSYEAIEGLITYNPTVCMYWQQFGWIKWPCYTLRTWPRVSTYQINTIMDPTRTPLNVLLISTNDIGLNQIDNYVDTWFLFTSLVSWFILLNKAICLATTWYLLSNKLSMPLNIYLTRCEFLLYT